MSTHNLCPWVFHVRISRGIHLHSIGVSIFLALALFHLPLGPDGEGTATQSLASFLGFYTARHSTKSTKEEAALEWRAPAQHVVQYETQKFRGRFGWDIGIY